MLTLRVSLPLVLSLFFLHPGSPPSPTRAPAAPELAIEFVDTDDYRFTEEDRRVIREIGAAAVDELGSHLPGAPSRIELIVRAGPSVIPETGDAGAALAPGRIGWTADPGRDGGVVGVARARLRRTLFHEVHHLTRGWTIEGGTAGGRIIDAAVAEGMATAFERDAAGWDPPWGDYSPEEAGSWADELLAVRGMASYGSWMFEHPDGRRWIGYRAGTFLVDRAMAASGRSAAELVTTHTDEILALAGWPRR